MNKQFVLVLAIFALLSFSFAASMWYDFTNTYATDGNAIVKAYFDLGDNGVDEGYDLNFIIYDDDGNAIWSTNAVTQEYSDGIYAEFIIDLNVEGNIDINGIDYNFFITDLNDLN